LGVAPHFYVAVVITGAFALCAAASGVPRGGIRSAADRCIAAVPFVTTLGVIFYGIRNFGISPSHILAGVAVVAVAIPVLLALERRPNVPIWALALALIVPLVGFGAGPNLEATLRLLYLLPAVGVILGVLLLPVAEILGAGAVRDAIADEIGTATVDASDELYDQLHQLVLNRLTVADSLAAREGVPDVVRGELQKVESAVRMFRATTATRSDLRIGEVISAVVRSYRHSVSVTVDASPSDLAVEVDAEDASHLARLLDELVANAAKHAHRGNGSTIVVLEASRSGEAIHFDITDDGQGLSDAGDGTLSRLIADTNRRPGWNMGLVPSIAGAHFRIDIETQGSA
jgi:anti-sigma regulatory factor (Ser/Thr protein kinase)